MRLGIDFGTTRVVVALVDRGNFPLVNFEAPDGLAHDWFPPVAAVNGDRRCYGWEAIAAQDDENWTVLRSLKRHLRSANPHTLVTVDDQQIPLRQLMAEMMIALKQQLLEHSNAGADSAGWREKLEVMLGVPANASSNQRFLTEDAAQAAGFTVLGLLNEPSAAAIEFTHRNSAERKSRIGSGLVVYDLGGGTFDVSLLTLGETEHTVEASDGIASLGGDDFDEILAEQVLESLSASLGKGVKLKTAERYRLMEECREKKESLNPNTRRITIDMERVRTGWEQVTVAVEDYYERCRPLIEQTRAVVDNLLAAHSDNSLDTLYVTGGAAELPPVARILRERCGVSRWVNGPGSRPIQSQLRHLARDRPRRNHPLRPDLSSRRATARARPRAPARRAHLPSGAQHWPLPLSRVFASRRAGTAQRRDRQLGPDSFPLRSPFAAAQRPGFRASSSARQSRSAENSRGVYLRFNGKRTRQNPRRARRLHARVHHRAIALTLDIHRIGCINQILTGHGFSRVAQAAQNLGLLRLLKNSS